MDKTRKSIVTLICTTMMALTIVGCGNKNENLSSIDVENDHITNETEIVVDNKDIDEQITEESASMMEYTNVYNSKLKEITDGIAPTFQFNYPDGWTIINEEMDSDYECIELENDKGVVIRFQYLASSFAYGNPTYEIDVDILEITDSRFIPAYAVTTDYSGIGKFAVVEVDVDNNKYYAVKPKSECGVKKIEGNFMTGFWYDGVLEFSAQIPENISVNENEEIINILSSFRLSANNAEKNEITTTTDTAIQEDDFFTKYAGVYKAAGIYEELYGGGEAISDLRLDKNGIVTEGGTWFQENPYPESKPISVTKNEDGSYKCQVRYESEDSQDYFVIYPVGVIGENPYIYNDPFLTEHVYIQYMAIDGGVMDIIYYKVEE